MIRFQQAYAATDNANGIKFINGWCPNWMEAQNGISNAIVDLENYEHFEL